MEGVAAMLSTSFTMEGGGGGPRALSPTYTDCDRVIQVRPGDGDGERNERSNLAT